VIPAGIGLGLAAIGRPAYITLGRDDDLGADRSVATLARRSHELLDAAWAAGVRYYDAARSYGRAEEFLASWLDGRDDLEGIVVGSKWGYTYTGGWSMTAAEHEHKDLSVATLRRQLAETRALLGDRLNLYQIHSATLESGVLDDPAVLEELAALRAAGVAIGLSTSGPQQGETIDRAIAIGAFDTVQSTWNLLERSAGPALQRAHDAGVAVIVKEALANGRLTGRNDDPAFAPARGVLAAEASRLGVGLDALALAAALANPWADVVLSGAATPEQLRANLDALEVRWDDRAAERLRALAEPPEAYWSRRSRLPWN
jgi:aryl-alcohol dehydrogenase-like predicted oxidoreductase